MPRSLALFLLLLATLFWGLGNVGQKIALEDVGPLHAITGRALIGFLVVLPLCCLRLRTRLSAFARNWRLVVPVCLLFVAAIMLQQGSLVSTTATNGGFLVTATAAFTPIATWVMRGLAPRPAVWAAVFLTLVGAYLMSGTAAISSATVGDLMSLGSALLYALWFATLGILITRVDDAALLTALQLLATVVVCGAGALTLESASQHSIASALPAIACMGVFSTAGAFLLQTLAQPRLGTNETAIICSMEGVFAMLGGILLLAEHVTYLQMLGGAIITMSALLTEVDLRAVRQGMKRVLLRNAKSPPRDVEEQYAAGE